MMMVRIKNPTNKVIRRKGSAAMMMQWCNDGDNIDGDNGGDNRDDDSKSCPQGDPSKDQQRWPAGKGGGRGEPGTVSCCHHWLQLLSSIYITVYYSITVCYTLSMYYCILYTFRYVYNINGITWLCRQYR